MKANINRELLKIRIQDQLTRYLRNPSAYEKQQLHTALLEYKALFESGEFGDTQLHELEQVVSQ